MSSRLSYDFPASSTASQSHHPSSYGASYAQATPAKSLYHEGSDGVDEAFDVRADFDGDGPRWSDKYPSPPSQSVKRGSYMPVGDRAPSMADAKSAKGTCMMQSREELVSVPILGPEWQKSELHELSRRGQAEEQGEKRTRAWREWTRDQRGTCGVRWLTRKMIVFGIFVLCAALAVVLFFTIPRPPSFQFYVPSPFTVDNSTIQFSRSPTNFSFTGNLNLLADTSGAYLPTQFSDISVTLYDLDTNAAIATGNYGSHRVPKGDEEPILIPVQFSYQAVNASDPTWNSMYSACGHLWPGTTRPDLKLRLVLQSSIVGLVTKPATFTQLSDITCPFELSANSV